MHSYKSEADPVKHIVEENDGDICAPSGVRLTATDTEISAKIVIGPGNYRILNRVGAGGMGEVYKAVHKATNKVHAVKMIRPELVADPKMLKRFQQEANAATNLTHANLAAVYEQGCTKSGAPFLVMDFIEGQSLAELLSKEGKIEAERALRLFVQIAEALSHAHRKNVLHRDIKPSNIMLVGAEEQIDQVKVLDFGIAKVVTAAGADLNNVTHTAQVLGSPTYMSPEQCLGRPLDFRADVYAFGCLMYETLSGKPPFVGDNAIEIIARQIYDAPAPLSLTGTNTRINRDLEQVISLALEKDPARRYQSIDELRMDLLRVQAGKALKKRATSASGRAVSLFAILGLLVGVVAFSFFWSSNPFKDTTNDVSPARATPLPDRTQFKAPNATIEIKNLDGVTLYRTTTAQSMRTAVEEAVAKKVNLSGADFRGESLPFEREPGRRDRHTFEYNEFTRRVRFDHMNLSYADFAGSNLGSAEFIDCDLTGANFTGAKLNRRIEVSRPRNSDFTRPEFAAFKGCNMRGARLVGANISACWLGDSDLTRADLTGATVSDSVFEHCTFQSAKMLHTDFSSSFFNHCIFSNADVTATNFKYALFQDMSLTEIKASDSTDFAGCRLIGDSKISVQNQTIRFKPPM